MSENELNTIRTEYHNLQKILPGVREELEKAEQRKKHIDEYVIKEKEDLQNYIIKKKTKVDDYCTKEYKELESNKHNFQARMTAKKQELDDREQLVAAKEQEVQRKLEALCKRKDEVSLLLVEQEKKAAINAANQRHIDGQNALIKNMEKTIGDAKSNIRKHELQLIDRAKSLEDSKKAVKEAREKLRIGNKALIDSEARLKEKAEELGSRESKLKSNENTHQQFIDTINKDKKAIAKEKEQLNKLSRELSLRESTLESYEESLKIREVKARRVMEKGKLLLEGISVENGKVVELDASGE
jgi:chromosome segregation ATPase